MQKKDFDWSAYMNFSHNRYWVSATRKFRSPTGWIRKA